MKAAPTEATSAADALRSGMNGQANSASDAAEVEKRHVDDNLVKRLQNGDQTAFRELFERYHRRAYAIAMGVVKNTEDAGDVVQDAFIKVHKNIASFQGNSSFYTWFYRIVMNLSIDQLRRRKKVTEFDDGYGRDDIAGDGALVPSILDSNPSKTVRRRELSEQIQQALAQLPEYHRAVLLLREVEGLSYEEMAEVLEVPKGTIMSRLFHARKKMQEILAVYVDGDLKVTE